MEDRRIKNRNLMLIMLVVVYTFNFIDRQIIGILAVPIKADLGLSDSELGLMGGLAFALFYTGLGIPIAWAADRFSRTWIMTIALTLWSLMTAVCGLAQNFWQLFGARLGVGVGEAGGVAPAYSLIADYFEPQKRARAFATFSLAIPLGSAIGIVFGGLIAEVISWRAAFIIIGLAGVLIAPVFRLVMKEPKRGGFDASFEQEKASIPEVITLLVKKPSFWLMAFGASSSSMMGYGLFFWLPSFLIRSHGLELVDASLFFGAILLIGGSAGIWLGGVWGDKFGVRDKGAYARVPAFAFLTTIPFYVGGILTSSLPLLFLVFMVPTALGLVWLGPVTMAIQHLVPAHMRATASAVFLFVNNLLGIGLGTYLLGALSDGLSARFGDEALRYSILAGTGFYVLAAILFLLAARRLKRDWHEADEL